MTNLARRPVAAPHFFRKNWTAAETLPAMERGPVPLIVKDNYETTDMPTSAGSLSLKGVMSKTDAFQIKRLRAAGAIMLAKSNMAEFAFDPMETVNSLLPGYTRNPYALDRVTAGSSGGTAAAVAASFGAVGLGTDTGNSIRGPSSHTSLVAFVRRWDSRAAPESCRSSWTRTSAVPWRGPWPMPWPSST